MQAAKKTHIYRRRRQGKFLGNKTPQPYPLVSLQGQIQIDVRALAWNQD